MRTNDNNTNSHRAARLASAAVISAASLLLPGVTPIALASGGAAQQPAAVERKREQAAKRSRDVRRARLFMPYLAGIEMPEVPAGVFIAPPMHPGDVMVPPAPAMAAAFDGMRVMAPLMQESQEERERREAELERLREEAEVAGENAREAAEAAIELSGDMDEVAAEALVEAQAEMEIAVAGQRGKDSNDPAIRLLEEGRRLVDRSEWAQAADKYREFLAQFGQHKLADSAHYWQSYSLKKQGRYQEAYDLVTKMIATYPKSRWNEEARKLKVELAQVLGKRDEVDAAIMADREVEVKVRALQGVFNSNPERGLVLSEEILKPGSTAHPRLKRSAVILLTQSDSPRVMPILLNIVRTATEKDVKRAAVIGLAQSSHGEGLTDEAFTALKELAIKGTDEDLAQYAVVALGEDRSPRTRQLMVELAMTSTSKNVRRQAILRIGEYGDEQACTELGRIFDSGSSDTDSRRMIVNALADNESACGMAKVEELARKSTDTEVRRFAIIRLADRDPNRAANLIIGWYDAEKNETIKESLINGLGQASESGSTTALRKLIQIVRTDPIPDMRKKAIFWIGQSNDPEATKFLEELLK